MVSQVRKIRKENKDKTRCLPAPLPGENPTRPLRLRPTCEQHVWALFSGCLQQQTRGSLSTQPESPFLYIPVPLRSVFKPRNWGSFLRAGLNSWLPRKNSGFWVPSLVVSCWATGGVRGGGGICPSCPLLCAPSHLPSVEVSLCFCFGVFFQRKAFL